MFETFINTLTPFAWGVLLALLWNIPLCAAEKQLQSLPKRSRRAASLALVLLGIIAALFLGLWLLIPQLVVALMNLSHVLPIFISDINNNITTLMGNFLPNENIFYLAFENVEKNGQSILSSAMQYGASAAAQTADGLYKFFMAFILSIYFLASKENLAHKGTIILRATLGEKKAKHVFSMCKRASEVFSAFVSGQFLEATILAGLFIVVLFFTGMPYALPVSVVLGVTALVPIFGSIIGCSIGFILIASVSVTKGLWFLLIFFAIQQLENHCIYPRIVGSRVNLPPLWVIVAVILGNGFFGIAGLLIAIPAMSVIYQLGGDWVHTQTENKDFQ